MGGGGVFFQKDNRGVWTNLQLSMWNCHHRKLAFSVIRSCDLPIIQLSCATVPFTWRKSLLSVYKKMCLTPCPMKYKQVRLTWNSNSLSWRLRTPKLYSILWTMWYHIRTCRGIGWWWLNWHLVSLYWLCAGCNNFLHSFNYVVLPL